uniref:Fibroblast growth factor binding protein 2b n=2 Tax=Astyanax mexicanus TaxID=7994 RepID=A0A8B9RP92_ASTMX
MLDIKINSSAVNQNRFYPMRWHTQWYQTKPHPSQLWIFTISSCSRGEVGLPAFLKGLFVGLVYINLVHTSNPLCTLLSHTPACQHHCPGPRLHSCTMRVTCSTVLLLACCVWVIHAQAQSSQSVANQDNSNQANVHANESTPSLPSKAKQEPQQRNSVWDEPIRFSSKAKDSCTLVISGQGDFTKLRVSCKNKGKSYWCDFLGKPNLCRPYNKNPRHYFTQVMWELRKLPNACQGPRVYKPQMCRTAGDEAQMVFHNSWPKTTTSAPVTAPQDRSQSQPKQPQPPKTSATPKPPTAAKAIPKTPKQPTKPVLPRKPSKTTTAKPTTEPENRATKLAEEYCWSGIQNVCAYFIAWFQNQ